MVSTSAVTTEKRMKEGSQSSPLVRRAPPNAIGKLQLQ